MMDSIILLLPQVAYSLFARMTNWVAKNYLVNLTNLLGGNDDRIRYNPGEVYIMLMRHFIPWKCQLLLVSM